MEKYLGRRTQISKDQLIELCRSTGYTPRDLALRQLQICVWLVAYRAHEGNKYKSTIKNNWIGKRTYGALHGV